MNTNLKVNWAKDLGNPKVPTEVRVKGLGIVEVQQEDIERAESLGGDLDVELAEDTSIGAEMRTFILGRFIPA